ncbi:MAG: YeeE/YedE family protein [Rhodoferax sp.]|nr:YeeE/YedE family protein [Rhodoferax sp.]
MLDYTQALQGGILIGLATWILLAGVGRIGGVSSIASSVLTTRRQPSPWRWFFLFGLVAGGAFFAWLLQAPSVVMRSPLILVPAGFLVGFGTVLGSGCTSGHGVCGLGRRSQRSLVAVLVFMGTAITTVLVASLVPAAAWWESALFDGLHWLLGRQ